MSLNRRHFLRLALASIFYASQVNTVPVLKGKSVASLEKWLEILLPNDHHGKAGTHEQVYERFEQLLSNKEFAKGINLGLSALEKFEPTLKNQQDLNTLMKKKLPEAKFLTALYELLLESYYGQECGWQDLKLVNPLIK